MSNSEKSNEEKIEPASETGSFVGFEEDYLLDSLFDLSYTAEEVEEHNITLASNQSVDQSDWEDLQNLTFKEDLRASLDVSKRDSGVRELIEHYNQKICPVTNNHTAEPTSATDISSSIRQSIVETNKAFYHIMSGDE